MRNDGVVVIRSFRCKETEKIFEGRRSRKFAHEIQTTALRKLQQIHISERLDDLKVPPGNRLERLRGNRAGQYSIRVNDQWRICFRWKQRDAFDVEMVDYH